MCVFFLLFLFLVMQTMSKAKKTEGFEPNGLELLSALWSHVFK